MRAAQSLRSLGFITGVLEIVPNDEVLVVNCMGAEDDSVRVLFDDITIAHPCDSWSQFRYTPQKIPLLPTA